MGNEHSKTSNKENNAKFLFRQKSFHSVHDVNVLLKTDNANEKENVGIEESKSDIIEIPLTGLEAKPKKKPKKTKKKQNVKRIWKKECEAAINGTPNTNIIDHIGDIFDYRKRLAKGSSCCVLLCQHKSNKQLYALKEMNKFARWNPLLYMTERKILNSLKSHINIMTYFDSYIDKKCFYIASEYCGGGTLLDKIINIKIFTEKIAAKYLTTILNVVDFIHTHNIAHRDLKPNNIVFDKPGDDGVLKLIDFGDAIVIEDNEEDITFVGTLHYFTPEMIRNPKRKGWEIRKADIYCIGVIAYVLLNGCFPFHGKERNEIRKQILKGEINWPNHVKLTDECKDFVLCLLNQNVKQRFNAKQALSHKWLMGYASNDDLGDNLKKYQKEFHHSNMLQRLLIDAIFAEMNTQEKTFCIQELKKYKNKRRFQKDQNNINKKSLNTLSPNSKARRNSLIYEQEFVEFMIANHVDPNKAKIESHNLFQQVSMRQNVTLSPEKKSLSGGNIQHIGTPTLDAVDVGILLEQLIVDNAFEMSHLPTDEFGFQVNEATPEPGPLLDAKSDDILVSLCPKKNRNKNLKVDSTNKIKGYNYNLGKIKSMGSVDIDDKEIIKSMEQRSQSIKITNCNLKLSIEISRTLSMKPDISSTVDIDELDADDYDQYDEAIAFGRSESLYKTSIDLSKRASLSITVQQFKSLLIKAPQKLDIESVIEDLDPNNTGIIDLRNITNYSRQIEMED